MSLNLVPAGDNLPDEINVIIEIPAFGSPVKYEVDKQSGTLFVDRFLIAPLLYPTNYGYINQTLAEDGDPIDVLVPTPVPLLTGCVIRARPIGMLEMEDESGPDPKIIALPLSELTHEYDAINEIDELPAQLKAQIQLFFEQYKALEPDRWVKVKGWANRDAAKQEIRTAWIRAME